MNVTRRNFLKFAGLGSTLGLAACGKQKTDGSGDDDGNRPQVDLKEFADLDLDMSAWNYDSKNDCYYQLGLAYCLKPASKAYESLAIFVPGKYFNAEKSGDKYKCTINESATVGSFTPKTAPVVMPINSARLSAQGCPTAYDYGGLGTYLSQGLVYVYAGFRGRSAGYDSGTTKMFPGGAPWPVVDLKAAIRYLRYNAEALPFSADRIFAFGYGDGGGASAILGASGDSALFTKYLESIGAATHDAKGNSLSDAICGSASWCPMMSYDSADAAYEWMMGQFSSDGTRADGTWTKMLSNDLALSYGDYVNQMDLRDAKDKQLTLDAVEDGAYLDGSYYEYILELVQSAAADFFGRTQFPYTEAKSRMVDPAFPGDPNLSASGADALDEVTGSSTTTETVQPDSTSGVAQVQATVYDSLGSYLAALNGDYRWVTYSSGRKAARVSSLWDFVVHCRPANRAVSAYDAVDRSSTSNQLFGIGDESTLHFDATVSSLVSANQDRYATAAGWDAKYVTEWAEDITKKDDLDQDMSTRVNAMNPLYHLSGHYAGFGTATVAPHWRINSGLFQATTPLTAEANLALALRHYDGVQDVDFNEVWGKGYELAEREGDAQSNFVSWVVSCCSAPEESGE